jgi:hypothetical protein
MMRLQMSAILALALFGCSVLEPDRKAAEDAVRATMKDPAAALFDYIASCSNDTAVWYGNVNGKNSFGAYNGSKPFYYAPGVVAYAGDPRFEELSKRCHGRAIERPEVLSTEGVTPIDPDLIAPAAPTLQPSESPDLDPPMD